MKILFICSNLGRGGAEKQLIHILRHCSDEDIDVRLINLSRQSEEYWEITINHMNIQYFRIAGHNTQLSRLHSIYNCVRHWKPDIVWGWHFFTGLYAVPAIYLAHKSKLVLGVRTDAYNLLSKHRWAPLLIHCADALVANTKAALLQFKDMGVKCKNCYVLPNSIDENSDAGTKKKKKTLKTIGFCGNIHPCKGIDVWLRAIKALCDKGLRVNYIIGGRGDCSDYENLASDLGLSEMVEFAGSVECASMVKNIDMFVLPSRHEGCPNVLMEAMAQGVPCVATDVGGVGELIDHRENGLLVEPENHRQLAEAVYSLYADCELRNRLGTAAAAKMRGRTSEKIMSDYFVKIVARIAG